jgi:flagellar biosynthesis protein FliR
MLRFDEAWMVATVLLWARIGVLLSLSPIATATKAPATFWVLFSLVLAATLTAALGLRAPAITTPGHLAVAMMAEVGLGALLGFSLHCAFAAFVVAGRVMDLQMGFGMGSVLDPVTKANAPVVGVLLSMAGMAVFFAMDGHHAVLRGIAYGAQVLPPGAPWGVASPADLLRPVGAMFTFGVMLVAPVLLMLLMVELVLGVCSRVLPQMNVLMVGMPAKILVGLMALAVLAPSMGPAMRRGFASVFDFWMRVLP